MTLDSIYAIARICYGSTAIPPDRPSVCLSVTRVDQPKTVKVRITQFSPYSSPIPLVFADKFHSEILMKSPDKGEVGKTWYFLALCVNISKTVGDTSKVAHALSIGAKVDDIDLGMTPSAAIVFKYLN